jgi:hypothetical protein
MVSRAKQRGRLFLVEAGKAEVGVPLTFPCLVMNIIRAPIDLQVQLRQVSRSEAECHRTGRSLVHSTMIETSSHTENHVP